MRILFAGTPEFAAGHLRHLIDLGQHELAAVFTQPDRPAGRGKQPAISPVKALAMARGIPIYQPIHLKDEAIQHQVRELAPDVFIVVAYGLILPASILQIPRYGCLNVHASLLPRWRGAAPIQRAIEAGDSKTGVTIMKMDSGLDTGDMLLKASCDIDRQETSSSLHDKLLLLGSLTLAKCLEQLATDSLFPEKQDDRQSSYAPKISKAEAKIDWHLDCAILERKIRAFIPSPVSFFEHGKETIRIWEAHCLPDSGKKILPGTIVAISSQGIDVATGHGVLRLSRIQLPGKRAMAISEILNGHPHLFEVGCRLHPAT